MFVGSINLGHGCPFDVIVTCLTGTTLLGRWAANTDLLMVSLVGTGRFCLCRIGDDAQRFVQDLHMSRRDADLLMGWLNQQSPRFAKDSLTPMQGFPSVDRAPHLTPVDGGSRAGQDRSVNRPQ